MHDPSKTHDNAARSHEDPAETAELSQAEIEYQRQLERTKSLVGEVAAAERQRREQSGPQLHEERRATWETKGVAGPEAMAAKLARELQGHRPSAAAPEIPRVFADSPEAAERARRVGVNPHQAEIDAHAARMGFGPRGEQVAVPPPREERYDPQNRPAGWEEAVRNGGRPPKIVTPAAETQQSPTTLYQPPRDPGATTLYQPPRPPETYGIAQEAPPPEMLGPAGPQHRGLPYAEPLEQRKGRQYQRRYSIARDEGRPVGYDPQETDALPRRGVPLAEGPKPEAYGLEKSEAEKKAAAETNKAAEAEKAYQTELAKTKQQTEDLVATMEKRNKAMAGTVRGEKDAGANLSNTSGVGTRRLRSMMDEAGDDPYKQAVVREEAARQEQRQREIGMKRARQEMGLPPGGGGRDGNGGNGGGGSGGDGASSMGPGGRMLGLAGMGGRLMNSMGIPGGDMFAVAAGPMASAVVAARMFEGGLRTATDGINLFGNASLTAAQKNKAFIESLPVIGGFAAAMHGLVDAMTGATEAIRANAEKRHMAQFETSARSAGQLQIMSLEHQQAAAENKAEAYAGYQMPATQSFDRSTFQGEIAHQEYQKRLPAQDARDRAALDVQAAEKTEADAQKRRAGTSKVVQEKGAEFDKARGEFDKAKAKQEAPPQIEQAPQTWRDKAAGFMQSGLQMAWQQTGIAGINPIASGQQSAAYGQAIFQHSESKKEMSDAYTKSDKAGGQYAAAAAENEKSLAMEMAATNDLILKRQMLRKAEVEMGKVELEIARQKTSQLEGQTARIGAMMPGQRMESLQALKMIEQHGMENATPEMMQAAGAAAPEWLRKKQQEHAETTDEYKEMQQRGYIREGGLKESREAEAKVQQDVRVMINMDEVKTADEVAKRVGPIIAALISAIEVKVEKQIERNKTNVAGAHGEKGG